MAKIKDKCSRCQRPGASYPWVVPGAGGAWRVCGNCHRALMAEADIDARELNEATSALIAWRGRDSH